MTSRPERRPFQRRTACRVAEPLAGDSGPPRGAGARRGGGARRGLGALGAAAVAGEEHTGGLLAPALGRPERRVHAAPRAPGGTERRRAKWRTIFWDATLASAQRRGLWGSAAECSERRGEARRVGDWPHIDRLHAHSRRVKAPRSRSFGRHNSCPPILRPRADRWLSRSHMRIQTVVAVIALAACGENAVAPLGAPPSPTLQGE